MFIYILYKSFAALRMTALRIVVILSAAKDLYIRIINNDEFQLNDIGS